MLKKYCFVRPCPRCGSERTGYFVYCNEENADRLIASRMKKGELVRVRNSVKDLSDTNCFCEACKIEWNEPISVQYLYPDEIEEEKKLREITNELANTIWDRRKKSKKENKMPFGKKIIRSMFRFFS